MRLKNLSDIHIPRQLWYRLVSAIGLGGRLPQALEDEYGIYGKNRTLRVSVNPGRERNSEHESVVVGTYTFGHIALFPCPRCSLGFMTFTFLHELHHAWLHQYKEKEYEEREFCEVAEGFAGDAFSALGGKVIEPMKCADYILDTDLAEHRIDDYCKVVSKYCRYSTTTD